MNMYKTLCCALLACLLQLLHPALDDWESLASKLAEVGRPFAPRASPSHLAHGVLVGAVALDSLLFQ